MSWDQDNFLAHDNFSYQTFDDSLPQISKSMDVNQSLVNQMNLESRKPPVQPVKEWTENFVQSPRRQSGKSQIHKQIELLKKKNETLTIFIIVLVVFILLSKTSIGSLQPQYVFVPVNSAANSLNPPTYAPTAPPLSPV